MFSVTQETETGQSVWPDINHVQTFGDNGRIARVTVLSDSDGVHGCMDFHASRNKHIIYVMNEKGATVARYNIGNNPDVPEPVASPLAEAA